MQKKDFTPMIARLESLQSHIAECVADDIRQVVAMLQGIGEDVSSEEMQETLRTASDLLDQLQGLLPKDLKEVGAFAADLRAQAQNILGT